MAHLLISAAHKSSGKTTLSVGLCAALRACGHVVQACKKGPDYIDPLWLQQASTRPCINLDFYTMGKEEIRMRFAKAMLGADIGLIEGNKGLYDGLDLDGSNSNAALAMLLHAPVVLVLDAVGMTRGIAPLILGYQAFEPGVNIVGVILNRLGGNRHEQKLRRVIEHYTDVEVLGAVHRDAALSIDERHLGLVPCNEISPRNEVVEKIAKSVAAQVNIAQILSLAQQVLKPPKPPADHATFPSQQSKIRIGIARDAAFGFYYPDDLEALEQAGAELVFIDCLQQKKLPLIEGLFLGGGFPEMQMEALEANISMREDIKAAIERGLPVYAECGGLMYLSRSLQWKDKTCAMVGVIQGDIEMCERPQGRGYVLLEETADFPWSMEKEQPSPVCGHEFHYSKINNLSQNTVFGYRVRRGFGIDGQHDGIVYKNVFASYMHLRNTEACPWAWRFMQFVVQCKSKI